MLFPAATMPEPATAAEARAIQEALREKLRLTPLEEPPETVLGVDVGYNLATGMSRASLVHLTFATLEVRQTVMTEVPTTFPYVPGLLSFREIPAILEALRQLQEMPSLLMVDGHGIAHPRRMGIAAHLGALLDVPSIGVAKKRLCGEYTEPDTHKGAATPLLYRGEQVGTVLRSRDSVKPLFISPGQRMDVAGAEELVRHCILRHRLPEPTRLADKLSKTPK